MEEDDEERHIWVENLPYEVHPNSENKTKFSDTWNKSRDTTGLQDIHNLYKIKILVLKSTLVTSRVT